MADAAEERSLGYLVETDDDDDDADENETEKDGNTLLVLKGASLGFCVEVFEERLYQIRKDCEIFPETQKPYTLNFRGRHESAPKKTLLTV